MALRFFALYLGFPSPRKGSIGKTNNRYRPSNTEFIVWKHYFHPIVSELPSATHLTWPHPVTSLDARNQRALTSHIYKASEGWQGGWALPLFTLAGNNDSPTLMNNLKQMRSHVNILFRAPPPPRSQMIKPQD